jgi:hypothetical protein
VSFRTGKSGAATLNPQAATIMLEARKSEVVVQTTAARMLREFRCMQTPPYFEEELCMVIAKEGFPRAAKSSNAVNELLKWLREEAARTGNDQFAGSILARPPI